MRRSLLALPLLCLSLALAGCENMDPAYWLPDNKKKLPGERREVFPEGIPGVVQGVPAELVKGNPAFQAENDPNAAPAPQAEQAPAEEKPKPKARPRTKVVRPIEPPPEDAQPEPQTRPRQAAPRQAQPAPSGGAWPAPQTAQQPQQQQQAPAAASGWPAPPASGTFTR